MGSCCTIGPGFAVVMLAAAAFSPPAAGAPSESSQAIPFYSPKPITALQLEGRSLRELELMRSTIRARAGQVFAPWWLELYFSAQPWYRPTGLDERQLSQVDRANLETLDRYERQLSRKEVESRLKVLVDQHGHAFTHPSDKVAFSPNGRQVLAAYPEGAVMLWDAGSGDLVFELNRGRGYFPAVPTNAAVGFSQDGGQALAATTGRVIVWDVADGKAIRSFSPGIDGDDVEIQGGAFSPDGRRALIINWRGRLSLWDATSGARIGGIDSESGFDSVAFLPDGKRAVLSGPGVAMLDTATWKIEVRMLAGQGVNRLELAPRGNQAIAWQWDLDKTFGYLFEPSAAEPHPFQEVPGRVSAFSPDGKRLFVGEESGRITVWDLASRRSRELRGPTTRELVGFETDEREKWSLANDLEPGGRFRAVIGRTPDFLQQLVVSPDGKKLLAVGAGLVMIDTDHGQAVGGWRGHEPWTLEDATEVALLSRKLGVPMDSRWPMNHLEERSPLAEPALLDQVLTGHQLANMDRAQLWLVRNLIYARRGRPFQSAMLRSYSAALTWYKPDPGFSDKRLTSADRQNLRRVSAREKALGGRFTERQFLRALWALGQQGMDGEP
jgi:WD40 repeat protein